jgi:hypothetical protein
MGRQSGGGGQSGYPVDNLTYDLLSVLHTKLEGLAAYQKYMQDTQGDQECQQLFQQLQQQDGQAAQQVMQMLAKRLGQQGGMGQQAAMGQQSGMSQQGGARQ